jgi:hypothetical protein
MSAGSARYSAKSKRAMRTVNAAGALGVTMCALLPVLAAPTAAATPTTHLKSEIDSARGATGCPPLQLDPALNGVSEDTTREVDEYVRHAGRFLPPSNDKDLLQVLRDAGYSTVRARLLIGYGDPRTGGPGDNEAKAIKAAVLEGQGYEAFTDCAYTKYGLSAVTDDSSQGWPSTAPRTYAVAPVVLSGT